MEMGLVVSLRDRLRFSERVSLALDYGIWSDTENVLAVPRDDVYVSEPEKLITDTCIALHPASSSTDVESHRTDMIIEVVPYAPTMEQLGIVKRAIAREINSGQKGCFTVPGIDLCVGIQFIRNWGPINREQGESRLYRCVGQFEISYFS